MESLKKLNCNSSVPEIRLSFSHPVKPANRLTVNGSSAAAHILRQSWDTGRLEYQEQFKVLLLNNAHHVLGIFTVADGGIDNCVVDIRILLAAALKTPATRLILAHNHPGGNPKPSKPDIALTRRIQMALEIFDIEVLDHIILTVDNFTSFTDEGLI